MPDGDDIAVQPGMLLDELAVDVGAVGALVYEKDFSTAEFNAGVHA